MGVYPACIHNALALSTLVHLFQNAARHKTFPGGTSNKHDNEKDLTKTMSEDFTHGKHPFKWEMQVGRHAYISQLTSIHWKTENNHTV